MFNQYSASGFYNAPITKGIIGCMFLMCSSLNFPAFSYMKKYVICKLPDALFNRTDIPSILLSKIAIVDVKDFIFTSLVLYYFRIFERRFGSYKFINFVMHSQIISTTIEILLHLGIHFSGLTVRSLIIPSGPYGLVFALFVYYFLDIPRVTQASVLGIPITGKTLMYILGIQMCTTLPSFFSAFSGVAAGLIYRYNLLGAQKMKWVPQCLSSFFSRFKSILSSLPPEDGQVGATLEIQRQEQIERWEQQLMNGNIQSNEGLGGLVVRNLMGNDRGNIHPANGIWTTPPTEEQIMTLVEMGFGRQQVVGALQSTNNDVNAASLILLHQT